MPAHQHSSVQDSVEQNSAWQYNSSGSWNLAFVAVQVSGRGRNPLRRAHCGAHNLTIRPLHRLLIWPEGRAIISFGRLPKFRPDSIASYAFASSVLSTLIDERFAYRSLN